MPEHILLPSGGWADLHTTVTFGRARLVRASMIRYRTGTPDERTQAPAEVVAAMTAAWSFGDTITTASVDALDVADADAIFERAAALYAEATAIDPKADATSSGSPPDPQ